MDHDNPRVTLANELFIDKSVRLDDICATLKISRSSLYRYVSMRGNRDGSKGGHPSGMSLTRKRILKKDIRNYLEANWDGVRFPRFKGVVPDVYAKFYSAQEGS
jgi:hypothetical protein